MLVSAVGSAASSRCTTTCINIQQQANAYDALGTDVTDPVTMTATVQMYETSSSCLVERKQRCVLDLGTAGYQVPGMYKRQKRGPPCIVLRGHRCPCNVVRTLVYLGNASASVTWVTGDSHPCSGEKPRDVDVRCPYHDRPRPPPPPPDRHPCRVSMTVPEGSSEVSRTAWVSRVLGVAFTGAAVATQVCFLEMRVCD